MTVGALLSASVLNMKTCLGFNDILDVGRPEIEEMQRIGDAYSSAEAPGACEAFTRQVRNAESVVLYTYRVAATLAKRAEELNEVAEIWSEMSSFCQSALHSLSNLKHKYPYCGTPELYDLVLDYKLACDKRFRNASEEMACQKAQFPKGLLPDLK